MDLEVLGRHPAIWIFGLIAGTVSIFGLGYTFGQSAAESQAAEGPTISTAVAEATTVLASAVTTQRPTNAPTIASIPAVVEEPASPTTSATTSTSTSARSTTIQLESGPVPLLDLRHEGQTGFSLVLEPGEIGEQYFDEILWCTPNASIEYRVDKKYSTFSAVVGYDLGSSGSEIQFYIWDENGVELLPKADYGLGDSRTVNVDISGALRLKIRCESSNYDSGNRFGLANPVLIRP